jgi:hypothetical protein
MDFHKQMDVCEQPKHSQIYEFWQVHCNLPLDKLLRSHVGVAEELEDEAEMFPSPQLEGISIE